MKKKPIALVVTVLLSLAFLPQFISYASKLLQQPETGWVVWETSTPVQRVAWDGSTLWAGQYKGGLSQWSLETGQSANYTTANGLTGNHVVSIAVDGGGQKWLALQDGSLNLTSDGASFNDLTPAGIAGENAWDVSLNGGEAWLATLGGGVSRYSGGSWTTYNKANSNLPYDDIYAVAANGGSPWVGTIGYGVANLQGDAWVSYTLPVQIPDPLQAGAFKSNQAVTDIVVDGSGNKWFATDGSGAVVLDASNSNWTVYNTSNSGISSDFIQRIYIDTQGNTWFGTLGGGVSRLSADLTDWQTYNTTNSPLPEDDVLDVTMDSGGGLWFAAYDSGLAYYGALPSPSPEFQLELKGQPEYTPGQVKGYYLWVNPDTFEWTLAWSGDGRLHTFEGEISSDSAFTILGQNGMEEGDSASINGNSLIISANEQNGEDSVTFKPDLTATELTIHLKIDGAYYPYNIHIGSSASTPGTAPFRIPALQPQAPVVNVGEDITITEGEYLVLSADVSDPDSPLGHTYTWDFGDTTAPVNTLLADHIYKDEGTYTAQLTVTDIYGLTSTDSVTITVQNVAPTADFYFDPFEPEAGEVVTFTGSFYDPGELDTHTITWDFGDGSAPVTGPSLEAAHTYLSAGTFQVTLTVADNDGGTSTANAAIILGVPPTPTFTPTPTETSTPTLTPTPTNTPTATPAPDLIFADGFESGNFSAWSWSNTNGGNLSVNTQSAAVGTRGMQALINSTTSMDVAKTISNNEKHFSARFYLDPNSINLPNGQRLKIFSAGDAHGVTFLFLERQGGYYRLSLRGEDDANQWIANRSVYITDAWQAIEIEWQASSAAGLNNGYMKLWVNDVLVDDNENLDTDTRYISQVNFGALSGIPVGTSGTVNFDSFEARRGSHIGLDPNGPAVFPPLELLFTDGFEAGDFSSWGDVINNSGGMSVSTTSAAIGQYGMQATANGVNAMYVRNYSSGLAKYYRSRFYFNPNSFTMNTGDTVFILASSSNNFRLSLRYTTSGYWLRTEVKSDAGIYEKGKSFYITNDWQAIEFEWKAATVEGANDGYLKTWINGTVMETRSGLDNDTQTVDSVSMGIYDSLDAGMSGTLYFDDFVSQSSSYIGLNPNGPILSSQNPPDLIMADDFEGGDFSHWFSSVTDLGDLSISSASAYQGLSGLQAVIDDTNIIYVSEDSAFDAPHYRARFYLDPNSLAMTDGNNHDIMEGDKSNHDSVFRIRFYKSSGLYKLQISVMKDNITRTYGSQYAISDDWHAVEIEWQASTAAGANNGSMSLWIDGTLVETISNVDNDTFTIGHVRLGAVSNIDASTSGTMYFDNFESRRDTYIGPVSAPATATSTSTPTETSTPTLTPDAPTLTPTATSLAYLPGNILPVSFNQPQGFRIKSDAPASLFLQQSTSITIGYTCDSLNRLTSAVYSDGRHFNYTYDANGNALSFERDLGPGTVTTTYAYDAANQLNTASEGSNTWQFTYDANGSLTSNGVSSYTYDSPNRLTEVSNQRNVSMI